ncbi:MAG: hypothetical protein ACRERE_41185 [Candidatus Entotheonellia bacterium]
MPLRESCFPRRMLQGIVGVMIVLAVAGCTYKPGYLRGEKTDVPNRWKVEKVEPGRLSEDQRTTLDRRGPPTYMRFFREVDTRHPVYAWIYAGEGDAVDLVWFVDGNRVEDIAVDSDPSAFTSTTRRRTRIALLVGTGAVMLPAIVLLAND